MVWLGVTALFWADILTLFTLPFFSIFSCASLLLVVVLALLLGGARTLW